MCGRFSLIADLMELQTTFGVRWVEPRPRDVPEGPRYNIAPRQWLPVILNAVGGAAGREPARELRRELRWMRWGIVPPWTPAEQVARFDGRTINARSETAAEKPTFKGPLAFRRCLVPATSYYEWETREWVESVAPPDAQLGLFGSESGAPPRGRTRKRTLKIPHRIWSGDGSLLALAGIYEVWGQGTPNALPTVSLFTRPANAFTARIHDRMPILLSSEDQVRWLDPTIRGIAPSSTLLARLAAGEPPELREAIASQRVNSPEQDDPSLWVADQESSSSS